MLQFPAFMTQYPWSTRTIPASNLMSSQRSAHPITAEQLLAMEEDTYDDRLNEIQKTNSNLTVIGKTTTDNDKDDDDNDADDDDADNADESDGEEFEQETG
ncbi:hypothetical protein LINGRAHAP2_LOCUS20812 [Linum grandiflorum]